MRLEKDLTRHYVHWFKLCTDLKSTIHKFAQVPASRAHQLLWL